MKQYTEKKYIPQFENEYREFMDEMDIHYRKSPVDVCRQEEILDQMLKLNPCASAFEKKSWIYQVAARECEIHLFRHCPFYFEVVTGRPRNSVGAAYPPLPGIDSWLMRRDQTGFLEQFQSWVKPYMDDDIIDSTMYIDCAHHAMGLENVLEYGFLGLKERAQQRLEKIQDPRQAEFLKSVISAQDSLIELTARFSEKARKMAEEETDEIVKRRLERIMVSAARCPAHPAETFYEALNTVWYLRELGNSLEAIGFAILGHVDRVLEKYYLRDLEKGIITREEAKDLITWFVALTDARWDLNDTPYGTNTSLNIGGCDREGKPVFNDITRFIIEAYQTYRFVNPKLQARFSPGAPREYFDMIADLAAAGTNVLSIFNDEILIKAHMQKGKALEDARLYVSGGCQEPVLSNTEFGSRAFCYLNPSKYLLMMIFPEKYDFFEKERIVPVSLENCRDFEEFYQRVFYNMKLIVGAITWRYNGFEAFWKDYNPCPFFSSTITGCIESGRDVSQGGARYNGNAYAVSGIGTFIDSMYALKNTVFDTGIFCWEEMKTFLSTDFAGAEKQRLYLKNKVKKYGKDDEELLELTRRICEDMAVTTSGMKNTRGGQYEASLWSFYGYEWLKAGTGATPDGRHAGETLARGINPAEYVETNIMEMVNSMSKVDLSRFPGSAVWYFEMPLTLAEDGNRIFSDLIRYFIACGGNVFDFDVVDAKALTDALKHPERHQNLVIRVCGFSARFVTLDREMQEEIVNRAKRMAG